MCQAKGRHLQRRCTEKNKNRNLYQIETLFQSQEFMAQVIRECVCFVFMLIKLIFIQADRNIWTGPFISSDSEDD